MLYTIADGSEIEINAGDSITLVEGGPDLRVQPLTVLSVGDVITVQTKSGNAELSPNWILARIKNGGQVIAPPTLEDNVKQMVSQAIAEQLPIVLNQVVSGNINPDVIAQILSQQAGAAFKTISKSVLIEIFNKVIEAIEAVE